MKTVVLQQPLIHAGNLILVNAMYPCQSGITELILEPVNAADNKVLLERNVTTRLSSLIDRKSVV